MLNQKRAVQELYVIKLENENNCSQNVINANGQLLPIGLPWEVHSVLFTDIQPSKLYVSLSPCARAE